MAKARKPVKKAFGIGRRRGFREGFKAGFDWAIEYLNKLALLENKCDYEGDEKDGEDNTGMY